MTERSGNRPAEVFGYPIWNQSEGAHDARKRHWCPFLDRPCNKRSRLIDYPFGVCSAVHGGEFCTICPRRFEEQGTIEGVSRVLEDIALHCFGGFRDTVVFSEVRLPNVGSIDYVLVRHKPMKPKVILLSFLSQGCSAQQSLDALIVYNMDSHFKSKPRMPSAKFPSMCRRSHELAHCMLIQDSPLEKGELQSRFLQRRRGYDSSRTETLCFVTSAPATP